LLAFLLVSAAIDEENYFTFKWLWQWSSIGQGHQKRFASRRMIDHIPQMIAVLAAPGFGAGRSFRSRRFIPA
jgi:hypothetical protein